MAIHFCQSNRSADVDRWLDTVYATIGDGFHPDTAPDAYSPPLRTTDQRCLRNGLTKLFDCRGDPYARAVAALRRWQGSGR